MVLCDLTVCHSERPCLLHHHRKLSAQNLMCSISKMLNTRCKTGALPAL